jgi:hypothetical protein
MSLDLCSQHGAQRDDLILFVSHTWLLVRQHLGTENPGSNGKHAPDLVPSILSERLCNTLSNGVLAVTILLLA